MNRKTNIAAKFRKWKEATRLKYEFVELVGRQRLNRYKEQMSESVIDSQKQTVRMRKSVADQLEKDLRKLRREEHKAQSRENTIDRMSKGAALIRQSTLLGSAAVTRFWSSWIWFTMKCPFSVLDDLAKHEIEPDLSNFSHYTGESSDVDCNAGNVLEMMNWMMETRLMPSVGSPEYICAVSAVEAIAESGQSEIEALKAALSKLRAGTYDVWKPIEFATIQDSSAASAIMGMRSA